MPPKRRKEKGLIRFEVSPEEETRVREESRRDFQANVLPIVKALGDWSKWSSRQDKPRCGSIGLKTA